MIGVVKTIQTALCGCSSVVEHLLAGERVESSNLFIRLLVKFICLLLLIFVSYFFVSNFEFHIALRIDEHLINS